MITLRYNVVKQQNIGVNLIQLIGARPWVRDKKFLVITIRYPGWQAWYMTHAWLLWFLATSQTDMTYTNQRLMDRAVSLIFKQTLLLLAMVSGLVGKYIRNICQTDHPRNRFPFEDERGIPLVMRWCIQFHDLAFKYWQKGHFSEPACLLPP